MFLHLFRFELRYWLRQPIVYIFFLVNALLVFGATSSDSITIGGGTGNVLKNAPYVVQNYYAFFSLLSLLMITAFLNSAAARDFNEKTAQILFSTPLRKRDFLLARFSGALVISIIPFLGVSVGNLVGSLMPWVDVERFGPVYWQAHLDGLLVFTIPNLLFAGSIIFSIAALTRNTILSFVGSIALLVGYSISQSLISDIDSEVRGALLDPFGLRTFSVATKYWTVDDRNTLSMGFEGLLLLNRVIWVAVGLIVFAFTWKRFSFSEKSKAGKKKQVMDEGSSTRMWGALTKVKPAFSAAWSVRQLLSQIRIESISIVKNVAFVVIMVFAAINLIASLSFATSQGYGLTAFPVTYNLLDTIEGSLYVFIVAVITFYSGAIVWKERESKVHDIYDALPYPDWLPVVSKTLAMYIAVLILLIIGATAGIITQLLNGFTDLRPELYIVQLLASDSLTFLSLIILSIFIHSVVNNRYLGYFLFIAVLIANSFVWPALDVNSKLLIYGASPRLIYSDMNAFGPFLYGKMAFKAYWLLAGSVLIGISILYWVRGRDHAMRIRSRMAWKRAVALRPVILTLISAWLICGGWLFYNTKVLNTFMTPDQGKKQSADYEKLYKRYEGRNQPRITDLDYHIELYPEQRRLEVSCKQQMKNKGATAIDTLFFTYSPTYDNKIQLSGSKLLLNDTVLGFAMYKLPKPLMPGDSMEMYMTMDYFPEGIENDITVTSIVDNGSFFNNSDILPQIGYQAGYEMTDKNDRKEYELPVRARMPRLSEDPTMRMNSYISNNSDWVHVKSVFGTSGDQTAIAPGSLRRQWKEKGRNYFHYELDHPSLNFYSFMSARYKVKKKTHKGINLEVYYDEKHAYNVDKMLMSMEKSIDYYSTHFGPYRHKQARIIEFPRYAGFAQAFPGTMPYSESIGFIANLEDQEDIDMVTYIVAHEMGHQWWAHQVVGPEMQGSTLLSESMSQYAALMVMEKMYGKEQMHKFLRYEMDNYLSARGFESEKESPLLVVENQGYLHYNKASTVMYYLKDMIGEEQVNAALKNLVDSFAYREPPYPTANELVNRLEVNTPDSLRYLIRDLFKKITLFDNRVLEASTRKVAGGFETTVKVQTEKLYADSVGRESATQLDDWIEVGLLAEPAEGKKYGKPIEVRRSRIRDKENTFVFISKEKPWQAGIDPFYYLVDRVPEDNLKRVSDN
jgi:ABC-type transport system involved in multi-copper enzyme maturation permease subunit